MRFLAAITENKNACAWFLMASAVGLHVVDETIFDFLPFYNQLVLKIRADIGFFPAPTFSFGIWLGGLTAAVLIGLALTPLVDRGGRVIRVIATIFGIIMVANGLGHIIGSIYFGAIIPGFWSSPLLLAAAVYMTIRGLTADWKRKVI